MRTFRSVYYCLLSLELIGALGLKMSNNHSEEEENPIHPPIDSESWCRTKVRHLQMT